MKKQKLKLTDTYAIMVYVSLFAKGFKDKEISIDSDIMENFKTDSIVFFYMGIMIEPG